MFSSEAVIKSTISNIQYCDDITLFNEISNYSIVFFVFIFVSITIFQSLVLMLSFFFGGGGAFFSSFQHGSHSTPSTEI